MEAGVGFRLRAFRCIVWITDAVGHGSPLYSYPYIGFSSPSGISAVTNLCRVIGINTGVDSESREYQSYAVNPTRALVPTSAISPMDAGTFGLVNNAGWYPLLLKIPANGTGLANAITLAVQALAGHGPSVVPLIAVDDTSDAVDVSTEFIARLVAVPGTGQSASDTHSDGYPETFTYIPIGETADYSVTLKPNTTVAPTTAVQAYAADMMPMGDFQFTLGSQRMYLVVPPLLY